MPRAPGPAKPRKAATAPAKKAAVGAKPAARPPTLKVAVPEPPGVQPQPPAKPRVEEPAWLVRIVLLLFLVGFAAFLAREVYNFVQALG